MILVTGGTGRIGRHLLAALLEKGESVRAIVRNEERAMYLPKGIEPFYADITKKESLLNAFKGIEKVVHLAGSVDYSADAEVMHKLNVDGTRNILEACPPNLKRFVHISSISVYGYRLAHVPADENTECWPGNQYGKTKMLGEREALSFASKLPVIVLRPGIVYGDGFDEGYTGVFEMLERGSMPILGDGDNTIPFVHVDDVVSAIMLALETEVRSGSVYNIIGKEQLTQREILALATQYLGVKEPKKNVPIIAAKLMAFGDSFICGLRGRKPKFILEYIDKLASNRKFDTSKAEKELGFRAKVKLSDGIRDMVRSHGGDGNGKG